MSHIAAMERERPGDWIRDPSTRRWRTVPVYAITSLTSPRPALPGLPGHELTLNLRFGFGSLDVDVCRAAHASIETDTAVGRVLPPGSKKPYQAQRAGLASSQPTEQVFPGTTTTGPTANPTRIGTVAHGGRTPLQRGKNPCPFARRDDALAEADRLSIRVEHHLAVVRTPPNKCRVDEDDADGLFGPGNPEPSPRLTPLSTHISGLGRARGGDVRIVQVSRDLYEGCSVEEVGDDPADDRGFVRMPDEPAVDDPKAVWPLAGPLALQPATFLPLLDAPGDRRGLGTGLLRQERDDGAAAWIAAVQVLLAEDDPASGGLNRVEHLPDMAHPPPRQPVERRDDQGFQSRG